MTQKALVLGAGFGGLAAAARLRARGYDVTILEAGAQAGGRARVFERDSFVFDAGPTVITAPYLFDELFQLFGKQREDYVSFLPVDPFYRVEFFEGGHFDYVGEEEQILEQIHQLSPADVDGYRKMAEHARRIFDVGYTALADQPFGRLSDMLRIVPSLVRLSAYQSVSALVSKYIQDPRLRQVFTFEPLLIGGNPLRVPGIYLLIHWLERKWGVHYAKGGTGALVAALVRLLEEEGVRIQYNSAVTHIAVSQGRVEGVELAQGAFEKADIVVSNADPTRVYSDLIAPEHLKKNTPRSVQKKEQSMSLFVGYFGTKKTYPELKHHTILLGPRYDELLCDIFDRKVLADDFSLYLHAPGRSDPQMAPEGHDAFYVLSPVPNQKSGIDWERQAEPYFEKILASMEQRLLPGLRENLVTQFSVDPRYFQEELRSTDGAAFGLAPRLTQSAYFRYHNACPDVGGLYFVGASTHPGAGLPGVLCSAKVLERLVSPQFP